MKNIPKTVVVLGLVLGMAGTPLARAQSEASALSAASVLPVASVVGTASVAAGALLVVPVALSATGAVLVVKAVEVGARGTVWVLERASDGARVSLQVASSVAGAASVAVGTTLLVTVVSAGVVISAAGEAIAFVPNALGRALLHDERITP